MSSLDIQAQPCTTSVFSRVYGSEGAGTGFFFDRLASGEHYFGGVTKYRMEIHKTDVDGTPIWDKQYRCTDMTAYSEKGFASVDSTGNYFINIDNDCIGLLDANGNPLVAKQMKGKYNVLVYGFSMGVLPDNKKVLLVKDQSYYGDGDGYMLICFSPDLSTIVWSKHFVGWFTYFKDLTVAGNKIIITGICEDVGTLLCFDAANGNVLKKTFTIDNKITWLGKIYRYNNGYILQAIYYGGEINNQVLLRLDDNFNVLNSYRLADVWNNASLALSIDPDGTIYGAWGTIISYRFSISNRDSVLWNRLNMASGGYPAELRHTPEGLILFGFSSWVDVDHGTNGSGYCLSRSDYNGNFFSCVSFDHPFHVDTLSCTTGIPTITVRDTSSMITLSPSSIIVSDDHKETYEKCKATSNCDNISIVGNSNLCNSSQGTFIARRNEGCFTPVIWSVTNTSAVPTKFNDSTVSLRFPQSGTYTLVATLSGCQYLSDTMQVIVTVSNSLLSLGPDTTICPDNTVLLNAGSGFTSYTWQDGSKDSVFNVTQPGMYHVKATDGCGAVYRDTIAVKAQPPIAFDAGPDRVKCNSDTIHLNAPDGFLNYKWSPDYQILSTNNQNVIANPLTDTIYTVTGEKTPGCFAHDTIYIKVYHSRPVDLGVDRSFCSGDSATFYAGNDFSSYTWSNQLTGSSITVRAEGIYTVDAVTEEGCHSFDTIKVVKVFPEPVVALDHSTELCAGSTRLLDAGNFSSYLWNDGSNGKTLAVNKAGNYFVKVTDENGCIKSDTTFITRMLPLPNGFLPSDTSICSYGNLKLEAKARFSTYLWSNDATTPSIAISKPGVYWLQVTDTHNCAGKEFINIFLKECMEGFYIPNAFSPNHDGKNDVFRPMLFGKIKDYIFIIYNRFGQKIFESTEPMNGWNGAIKGTIQQGDVFAWICTYQFEEGSKEIKKGTVTLIR